MYERIGKVTSAGEDKRGEERTVLARRGQLKLERISYDSAAVTIIKKGSVATRSTRRFTLPLYA